MKSKFVQDGKTLDYTNNTSSAIVAGDVVVMGSKVGVAGTDIAVGATGTVHMNGVFEFLKEDSVEVTVGQKVYYDATNEVMTTTSTSNTEAGYAAYESKAGSTTVCVKLEG